MDSLSANLRGGRRASKPGGPVWSWYSSKSSEVSENAEGLTPHSANGLNQHEAKPSLVSDTTSEDEDEVVCDEVSRRMSVIDLGLCQRSNLFEVSANSRNEHHLKISS